MFNVSEIMQVYDSDVGKCAFLYICVCIYIISWYKKKEDSLTHRNQCAPLASRSNVDALSRTYAKKMAKKYKINGSKVHGTHGKKKCSFFVVK